MTTHPTNSRPCTQLTRTGAADCGHCPVNAVNLFADLRADEMAAVRGRIDHYLYPAETVLYREGASADFVYTVRRGLVKVVFYGASGTERILRIHGPGDMIGLEAIAGRRYQHSALCIGEVDACRIPVAMVHDIGATHPGVIEGINQRWEQTVEKADFWITSFSTGAVRGRLVRLLLFLIELHGQRDGRGVHLLSGHDMAAIIGSTAETVSRELSALRRARAVRRVGSHSFDCDVAALNRLANE